MRYSSGHKALTRETLIEKGSALTKAEGFAQTGVDALMAELGLSGGSFYTHFSSKAELFAAIIEREMESSNVRLASPVDAPPDHVAKCLRGYLSNHHAVHPESGCAISTLGPEIARSDIAVKHTVEESLRKLHDSWAARLEGDSDKAWGVIAQCVGALLVSRCVATEKSRKEILGSSRRFLKQTIGLKI
jgi:AcrR family transcriptional regulator